MNEDGTFELGASLHEVGCGIVTVMKVIVAEVLGVDPAHIAAGEADTSSTPFDYGTFGSRVTYVVGACAKVTAEKLKRRDRDGCGRPPARAAREAHRGGRRGPCEATTGSAASPSRTSPG